MGSTLEKLLYNWWRRVISLCLHVDIHNKQQSLKYELVLFATSLFSFSRIYFHFDISIISINFVNKTKM